MIVLSADMNRTECALGSLLSNLFDTSALASRLMISSFGHEVLHFPVSLDESAATSQYHRTLIAL